VRELGSSTGTGIFISYRREDSEGEAGRLFDDLVRTFGDKSVFLDVAGIPYGRDFRKVIENKLSGCGVLLAVIGPTWASSLDSDGMRRLDNPNDFVRLEIATALSRDIPVIPVLVRGAKMPRQDNLPPDLRDLSYRNSVELSHTRWNSDVALLNTALRQYASDSGGARQSTREKTTSPPGRDPGTASRGGSSKLRTLRRVVVRALAFVIVAMIVFGIFEALSSRSSAGHGYSSQHRR
jgi:TIR domain